MDSSFTKKEKVNPIQSRISHKANLAAQSMQAGVSLGDGRVIHAWDMVRVDDYLAIEKLTALTGDHPKYLGWVALERVLDQKPRM